METQGGGGILEHLGVVAASSDRDQVGASAVALASSGDEAVVQTLGTFLKTGEFLARLDDLEQPQRRTYWLTQVLRAMRDHPNAAVAEVAIELANTPVFTSLVDRMNPLLEALAAVRPTPERAEQVIRETNAIGFYQQNVRLLVRNGSARALRLYEEMIADPEVLPSSRVSALHWSLVPCRAERDVLLMCRRLLDRGLEREVELGLIESIFDYQEKPWYGTAKNMPRPPEWETASSEALKVLLEIADQVRVDGELARVVQQTAAQVNRILADRGE